MALALEDVATLGERLDHPEGVAWDPLDGTLVAGGESGQIYRIDPGKPTQRLWASTGGSLLGVAVDGAGAVYACDVEAHAVMRVDPRGRARVYAAGSPADPWVAPNHLVFDPRGVLYVSDSGPWGADSGRILAVAPGGAVRTWSREPRRFPNGLALSPDGRFLYVVESTLPGVARLPILDDGRAGARQEVRRMADTVPDGLAFAADGSLIVTCYRPDRVLRLGERGELEVVLDDWQAQRLSAPTNAAFFGPRLERLALACFGGTWLAVCTPGPRGQPLHYPAAVAAQPAEGPPP